MTVILVVFFIVAISSWWLDEFSETAAERTVRSFSGKKVMHGSVPIPFAGDKALTKQSLPTQLTIVPQIL